MRKDNMIPSFEFFGGSQFRITAKKDATGEETYFYYNNMTNVLTDINQNVICYPEVQVDDTIIQGPSDGFNKYTPLNKSREVHLLKIQLGLSCNYSCDYCSQRFVERPPESSKKDIEAFMKKLDNLEFSEDNGLKIEFWGGEPLVYWKTLKPLVAALNDRFKSWSRKPRYSVITNGSILTPEICYWLMVNNFSVAISHDGPGQYVRGPDPFHDPKQKEIILDFYRAMKPHGRISFNSILTANNYSRKQIRDWFVDLTGDEDVPQGEGTMADAYDDGGAANILSTKAQHFDFRNTTYKDIKEHGINAGFIGILSMIDGFADAVLNNKPTSALGQKCGMDDQHVLAIDLKGNVITCQNVSAVETAPNGESHKWGNIEDMDNVKGKTSTHWRSRPQCKTCPVLQICKGSCMFLEGDNWYKSCDNAYSNHIPLLALAIENITGWKPVFIEDVSKDKLPDHRADIWGDILTHKEDETKRKPFPVKVVIQNAKTIVNDTEVYTKTELKGV